MSSKYLTIYNDLKTKIEDQYYQINEILPSEKELMEIYSASRDTIRKSLNLLTQDGYIIKEKGKGSIVLDTNKINFPVSGLTSFKELKSELGNNINTKLITLELIDPDESTMKRLNLKANEKVWYVERIRYVNGEAVILDTDVINAKIVPYLDKAILEDSLYEYLENSLNLNIRLAKKEITVQKVTNKDNKYLDLCNYDCLVNVKSYVYLDNGEIFEYTDSHHRPDKFKFVEVARRNNNKM